MSYYHIVILYGNNERIILSNNSAEQLKSDVLYPVFKGHVIRYDNEKGNSIIINLSQVSILRIYNTKNKLNSAESPIREQMASEEFQKWDCTKSFLQKFKVPESFSPKSVLHRTFLVKMKQVFVIIMNNDPTLDKIYHDVIKRTFDAYKFTVIRTDDMLNSEKLLDQTIQYIEESEIIFAELTGERPNCYYEVGYAHALKKHLILSIRKGAPIHANVSNHKFIEWSDKDDLEIQLKKRLDFVQSE